jgi:hypothetical protein
MNASDIIAVRTAQAVADAKVPQRRITRSVPELRCYLLDGVPLLCEMLEKPKDAIRHISRYRTLIGDQIGVRQRSNGLSVLTWTRPDKQCPS